jgi:hypothetical protein
MGAGIGSAVLLYSVGYMEKEKGATRFYSLVLIFIAGLIHLVYTSDLFLVYLSWELVGLCSFFLVGFWYRDSEAASGARKVLTMTHLAGYGLFAAVVLIYFRTGIVLWTDPRMQGRRGRKIGSVPAAYLDSQRHGGPHSGQRFAPCRLLRKGWRLPGCPSALHWTVARRVGTYRFMAGCGNVDDRRAVRPRAA